MKAINICGAIMLLAGVASFAVLLPMMLSGTLGELVLAAPVGLSVLGTIIFVSRGKERPEHDAVVPGAPSVRTQQQREIEEFSKMY